MAISYGATGITASSDTATPFANLSYTLPASSQQYDLLVVFYGGKPYNTVPSTPTDYTAQSGGANGTTTMGAGTGSVYAVAFTKEHDGSESNPSSTFSAQYSPGIRAALWVRESDRVGGSWTVTSCKGSDSSSTGTTYSATGDATLNFAPGDIAVVSLVHNDDSSSDSSFGLSIPGCTITNLTQRLTGTLTTGTGNDGRMYVLTAEIESGSASGAPTVTATTGSTDSDGQSVFLRLQRPAVSVSGDVSTMTGTASLTATSEVLIGGTFSDNALQAWYSADDLSLSNNDAVASWASRRGGVYGPTLSESTDQPTYKTNVTNSKPGVLFTKANSEKLGSSSGPYLRNVAGATVFIVGTATSGGSTDQSFIVIEANAADKDRLGFQLDYPSLNMLATGRRLDSDSYTEYITSTPAGSTAQIMRVAADYSAATIAIHRNGKSAGSTTWLTSGSTSDTDSNGIWIGSASTGGLSLNGYIFEILVFGRILTSGEISAVESYLDTKWTPPITASVSAAGTLYADGYVVKNADASGLGQMTTFASLTADATVVKVADASTPFISSLTPLRFQVEDADYYIADYTDHGTYYNFMMVGGAGFNDDVTAYSSVTVSARVPSSAHHVYVGDKSVGSYEATVLARAMVTSDVFTPYTLIDYLGTLADIPAGGFVVSIGAENQMDVDWVEWGGIGPTPNITASLTADATVTPPKISTFVETFDGDLSKWAVTDGQQTNSSYILTNDEHLVAARQYDLTESSVYFDLPVFDPGAWGRASVGLLDDTDYEVGCWVYRDPGEGVNDLRTTIWTDYETEWTYNCPYSAINHRFIRFRHASGTIYIESSSDGLSWSVLLSHADDNGAWSQVTLSSYAANDAASTVTIEGINTRAPSTTAALDSTTASLTVDAGIGKDATQSLQATATLTTAALVVDAATVTLPAATAALYSAGYVSLAGTTAPLSATTGLAVAGTVVDSTTATLATGTGSLSASGTAHRYTTTTSTFTASLTSAAAPARNASLSMSASGALTAAALVTDEGTGVLSGTASLTTSGYVLSTRTVAVAGTAALTSAGVRVAEGTVALTGTASLSGTQTLAAAGTAALSAAGTLTSAAAPGRNGTVAVSATGALTSAARNDAMASAALSGTATVTTAGLVIDDGTVVLPNGTATLTSAGHVASTRAVSVSTTGSLSASGHVALGGATTSLAASGSLNVAGLVVDDAATTLTTGAGTLTASGSINTSIGGTLATATASLSSTALVTDEGTGILTAIAGLVSDSTVVMAGASSTTTTTAALTTVAVRVPVGGVNLNAVAALTISGTEDLLTTLTVSGTASLTSTPLRAVNATTVVEAQSTLTSAATPERNATTILTTTAQATADGYKVGVTSGTLTASASVIPAALITDEGTGVFTAVAALSAAGQVTRVGTVSLTATQQVSIDGTVGLGTLEASSTSTAALTVSGVVVDDSFSTLTTATASLVAAGYQSIPATIGLTANATLSANGIVTDETTALLYDNALLTGSVTVTDASGIYMPPGTGHLTVIGYVSLGGTTVSLGASGSLSTSGLVVDEGGVLLAGTASLSMTATQTHALTTSKTFTASLAADLSIETGTGAALVASATVITAGFIGLYTGTVEYVIASTLTADATVVDEGQEALNVTASITADGYVVHINNVEMDASGAMVATATVARSVFIWNGTQYVVTHQLWIRSVGGWIRPSSLWKNTDNGWRKVYARD